MVNVGGKEGRTGMYEILIYSPRRKRRREGRFILDIRAILLWLMEIISLKSMEHTRNYYDVSKRFLCIVGQWPYQKPQMKLSLSALTLIVLAYCLFTQVILSKNFFRHVVGNFTSHIEIVRISRVSCIFLIFISFFNASKCKQMRFSDSTNFCMRRHTVYL